MEIGDASFDDRFFISTGEPEAVRPLLDQDVRTALLELQRATSSIEVSRSAIRAQIEGAAVTDPELLCQAIAAAVAAGEALVRAARPNRGGAYR